MAENALTLKPTPEMGKALVERAIQEQQEANSKQVVGLVQEVLVYIDRENAAKERVENNLKLLNAKIAALQAGEFTINRLGNIVFADKDLGKSVVDGPDSCPNCGYGRSGVRPGSRL